VAIHLDDTDNFHDLVLGPPAFTLAESEGAMRVRLGRL